MKPVPVFLLDRSISGEEICINYELIHLGFASLEVAGMNQALVKYIV